MFSALVKNTKEQIDIVLNLISVHNSSLSALDSRSRELTKVYSTASTVTRLYSILEGFIASAIADYLDHVSNEKEFDSLSDKFKEHYRVGFSNVLKKTHHEAYKSLSHRDLVNWYHEALSNKFPFQFIPQAFTATDTNYRLNTIENIFAKIQLKDFKSWISKSEEIKNLYSEGSSIIEQLESELHEFVKQRNDASHSFDVDITGPTVLNRYCELIDALVDSLAKFLRKETLSILIENGKYIEIGSITEVFHRQDSCVFNLLPKMKISKEDTVYILTSNNCYRDAAKSLQIEGHKTTSIKSKDKIIEVGIKLNSLPKKNSKLIKIKDWS